MWSRGPITKRSARLTAALTLVAVFALAGLSAAVREVARVVVGDAARAKHAASFLLTSSPSSRKVAAGGKATYSLSIFQRKYRGPVRMRIISRLPRGVSASLNPNPTRKTRSRLRLTTAAATRPATYRFRVRAYRSKPSPPRSALHSPRAMRRWRHATSGRRRITATVKLTVTGPATTTRRFTIGGAGARALAPGAAAPIDAWVKNADASALKVTSLSVSIARVDAPRADAERGCEPADFAIEQFSGPAFLVPPRSTRRLSELGIPSGLWPRLSMLNRPVSQDGCKGASVQLAFSGTGTDGS